MNKRVSLPVTLLLPTVTHSLAHNLITAEPPFSFLNSRYGLWIVNFPFWWNNICAVGFGWQTGKLFPRFNIPAVSAQSQQSFEEEAIKTAFSEIG